MAHALVLANLSYGHATAFTTARAGCSVVSVNIVPVLTGGIYSEIKLNLYVICLGLGDINPLLLNVIHFSPISLNITEFSYVQKNIPDNACDGSCILQYQALVIYIRHIQEEEEAAMER